MTERNEIAVKLATDLGNTILGKNIDFVLEMLENLQAEASERGCHRTEFTMDGYWDNSYIEIMGYRYETDTELEVRTDKEKTKKLKQLERKRARLEKLQAEITELETNDD